MKQHSLHSLLAEGLEEDIRRINPWWQGESSINVPPFKRWAFDLVLERITGGMAPIVALKGPRQVGKTTILNQTIQALLDSGVQPACIFRIQFDELPQLRKLSQPILELAWWYSNTILGKSFHKAASEGNKVFFFFDEIQNLSDWAPQVKYLVDLQPVRGMVTGSSSLRIEAGRDSLAGRIQTVEMGTLLLREIADFRGIGTITPYLPHNGISPLKNKETWQGLVAFGNACKDIRLKAFDAYSSRGAYPFAHIGTERTWEEISEFLNETVIRRVILHDLVKGPKTRKKHEHLFESVFRLACTYTGQSPSQALYLGEIQRTFQEPISWRQVLSSLKLLDGTLLMKLIEPLHLRLRRQLGNYKICLCDHALRATWLQELVPLSASELEKSPHLSDIAGRIAESAAGYFLSSISGIDIAHFPERNAEPEVDFVLTVGDQRIPVEIKYRRRIDYKDTIGLRAFIEKAHYNAPFGILVTQTDEPGSDDPRIISMPLSTLLMLR